MTFSISVVLFLVFWLFGVMIAIVKNEHMSATLWFWQAALVFLAANLGVLP